MKNEFCYSTLLHLIRRTLRNVNLRLYYLLIAEYDFLGKLIKIYLVIHTYSFRDTVNIFRRSQEKKNALTMQLNERETGRWGKEE